MKRVSLVQVGVGTVGGAVVEQVLENRRRWREGFGIDVTFAAAAADRRRAGCHAGWAGARPPARAGGSPAVRQQRRDRPGGAACGSGGQGLRSGPTVVIDAGAGDATADVLVQALDAGAGVVLSNKAPLALPMRDPRAGPWSQSGAIGRLRYEATTVPSIISTLQALLDTGDEVLEISGTLSGTFGAIFSDVGTGTLFSEAVRKAQAQGYTEPDPRDDLSGLDVARKGLILSRTIGEMIDLDHIAVHSLVPRHLVDVSVSEFLDRLGDQDLEIARQAGESLAMDTSLKYIMHWSQERASRSACGTSRKRPSWARCRGRKTSSPSGPCGTTGTRASFPVLAPARRSPLVAWWPTCSPSPTAWRTELAVARICPVRDPHPVMSSAAGLSACAQWSERNRKRPPGRCWNSARCVRLRRIR